MEKDETLCNLKGFFDEEVDDKWVFLKYIKLSQDDYELEFEKKTFYRNIQNCVKVGRLFTLLSRIIIQRNIFNN